MFAARLRALRFHLRGWDRYGGQVGAAGPIVWAVCLTCVIAGQEQATVWSGVYTEAQAYRGEKVPDTTCIGCHGPGLDGGDSGPKLVGEVFLANWSSQPVSELFAWIREAMPPEAAGTLSSEDTAAVVAYILTLGDQRAIPEAPILIGEQHQLTILGPRTAPLLVQQHQREQAEGLGVGQELRQQSPQPNRLGRDVASRER